MDKTEIVLSSDSSPDFGKKAKGSFKSDKALPTSSSVSSINAQKQIATHGQKLSLVDIILLKENSHTKCSKIGESHCYKTCQ